MKRALAVLCGALAGCGPSRLDQVEAELAALERQRVPLADVDAARREADGAEAEVARLETALADAQRIAAELGAKRDALVQRRRHATDDLSRYGPAREQAERAIADEAATTARLERESAEQRTRARALREQAIALERELQPGDPAWATQRRVAVLRELLSTAARSYSDDPAMQEISRAGGLAAADDPERARSLATRLRDRLSWVYQLDDAR